MFVEEIPDQPSDEVTFVKVKDTNLVLGQVAAAFYGFPSKSMKVVGITGTNGKTSIATLLHKLFRQQGYNVGLISTISYKINEVEETASHTTPDAIKIQESYNFV